MPNKKVLVITYYWYPFADVGTYRISRFCKYLARNGWEVIVLTAKKSSAGMKGEPDDPLLENIKVYRSYLLEPTGLLNIGKKKKTTTSNPGVFYQKNKGLLSRFAVWARLNLMIPDAKFTWPWFATSLGKRVIEDENPDLILSTSPPPSTSMLAKKLAEWSKLPWLADFRDPWTNIYYYDDHPQSSFARKKNQQLEKSVLQSATKITMVNHGFFPENEPLIDSKAYKIPNGFDPEHQVSGDTEVQQDDKFTIRYFGSLKANQHPGGFISALSSIELTDEEIAKNIRFEFYGSIDSSIKDEMLSATNLIDVKIHDFIDHNEMMKLVQSAGLLLLSIGRTKNSKFALSTKVFEYMLSGNPVLGIGPTDGAAADLVRETKIGEFFERDDKDRIKDYILAAYIAHNSGSDFVTPDFGAMQNYNFQHLSKQLEELMLDLIS